MKKSSQKPKKKRTARKSELLEIVACEHCKYSLTCPKHDLYYSKNSYPLNKIHNLQRVGFPAGFHEAVRPSEILAGEPTS